MSDYYGYKDEAYAKGRADERSDVMSWLRRMADDYEEDARTMDDPEQLRAVHNDMRMLRNLAIAIQHGGHVATRD